MHRTQCMPQPEKYAFGFISVAFLRPKSDDIYIRIIVCIAKIKRLWALKAAKSVMDRHGILNLARFL